MDPITNQELLRMKGTLLGEPTKTLTAWQLKTAFLTLVDIAMGTAPQPSGEHKAERLAKAWETLALERDDEPECCAAYVAASVLEAEGTVLTAATLRSLGDRLRAARAIATGQGGKAKAVAASSPCTTKFVPAQLPLGRIKQIYEQLFDGDLELDPGYVCANSDPSMLAVMLVEAMQHIAYLEQQLDRHTAVLSKL